MGLPGAVELIARGDSQAADSPTGAVYRSLGKPLLNSLGEVAFATTTSELPPAGHTQGQKAGSYVIFTGLPGSLRKLVRTGDPAPETEGDIYLQPDVSPMGFNASGAVAFRTLLWSPGPNPAGSGVAIYAGQRGKLRLVARTEFPAPDTEPGTVFSLLGYPVMNAPGEVAFAGTVTTATGLGYGGIWAGRPGQLRLIAREGVNAPGTAQTYLYLTSTSLTLSDSGQVAFSASLANAPAGQAEALFATDETGTLRLIARTGLALLGSPSVTYFQMHIQAGTGDGLQNSMDAQGRFAFLAGWNWTAGGPFPGSNAIFVASPGTSAPLIPASGQPAHVGGLQGGTAEFQVTALGTRPATYQWKRGSTILTGETGPTLSLAALAATDRASYSVVVTNAHGSLESAPATLTLPPVIASQPVSQSVGAGASPQFIVAADGFGPLSYSWEFQATGAPLFSPLGVATPTLTLTNAAVNRAGRYRVVVTNPDGAVTSAEAVLTIAPAGGPIIEKIVLKGDRAAGFPGEVFFAGGSYPLLNDSGEVAYDGGFENAAGISLQYGGAMGGRRGALGFFYFRAGTRNLNDSGVAVMITNALPGSDFVNNAMLLGPLGAVEILAREGSPAPGTANTFDSRFDAAINSSGLVAFKHTTNDPEKPAGVYIGTPGALTPVIFTNQQAPGQAAGVNFEAISAQVVLNHAGTAGFLANLTGPGITTANDEGIWLATLTGAQRVLAESDAAPGAGAGAQFGSWEDGRSHHVRINGAGQIAFANRLKGTGVDSSNNDAIFAGPPGALQLVAREGQTAGGFQFASLVNAGPPPIINESGQVAFTAYGGIGFSQSIWRWTPGAGGGTKQLIVREGQQAPGLPAGIVLDSSDFGKPTFDFAMNSAGQIVFQSLLSGPGVNEANRNNKGLWLTNAAGEPTLIGRHGDPFDIGGGTTKTLLDLGATFGSGGGDGLPRSLSSRGEVIIYAAVGNFLTYGIFRATLPASVPTAPFALTKKATLVAQTTAGLNGVVNASGFSTTARFEYGPTTGYGSFTAIQTFPAGNFYADLNAGITGLLPGTLYHYRLVAVNGNGTTQGVDLTFTTTAAAAAQSFADWATANQLGPDPASDTDFDGLPNFMEWASHSDPNKSEPPPETGGRILINGQEWLSMSYRRWEDRGTAGVTYTPQLFPPDDWTGTGLIDEVDPSAPVIPGSNARRCRVLIDRTKRIQLIRLKVVKP